MTIFYRQLIFISFYLIEWFVLHPHRIPKNMLIIALGKIKKEIGGKLQLLVLHKCRYHLTTSTSTLAGRDGLKWI